MGPDCGSGLPGHFDEVRVLVFFVKTKNKRRNEMREEKHAS